MGTRERREKQEDIWIAHTELATAPGHPFYQRLNELLEAEGFDEFVEGQCKKFYAAKDGRPSLTPGIYFRALLIGYFEGIDSERGIAWRLADSLALRRFVGIGLDEMTPDHSTISRTRRLIDLDTHSAVFPLGAEVVGGSGSDKRQAGGHRCDHLGSQRGDALDCTAGYGRELRAVSGWVGEGLGARHPHARTWRDWTASARSACRTRNGRVPQIQMHGSRR
jgi:hypothetical protein